MYNLLCYRILDWSLEYTFEYDYFYISFVLFSFLRTKAIVLCWFWGSGRLCFVISWGQGRLCFSISWDQGDNALFFLRIKVIMLCNCMCIWVIVFWSSLRIGANVVSIAFFGYNWILVLTAIINLFSDSKEIIKSLNNIIIIEFYCIF